jgi:hypothetical protein
MIGIFATKASIAINARSKMIPTVSVAIILELPQGQTLPPELIASFRV